MPKRIRPDFTGVEHELCDPQLTFSFFALVSIRTNSPIRNGKKYIMQYLSSFWEPFYSFWWYDWVSLPDRDDEDYDECLRKQKLSSRYAGNSNADLVYQNN